MTSSKEREKKITSNTREKSRFKKGQLEAKIHAIANLWRGETRKEIKRQIDETKPSQKKQVQIVKGSGIAGKINIIWIKKPIVITSSCGGSKPCKAGCSTHPKGTKSIEQEIKFMRIKKKDIRGKYNLKVKAKDICHQPPQECQHGIPTFQSCDKCGRNMVNDEPFNKGMEQIGKPPQEEVVKKKVFNIKEFIKAAKELQKAMEEEGWEDRFYDKFCMDDEFSSGYCDYIAISENLEPATIEYMKSFIKSLLSSQRQKYIEAIEGMKVGHIFEDCIYCSVLDDVLAQLRKKI